MTPQQQTQMIERRICSMQRGKNFHAITNVYVYRWESDVFSITRANRVTEFEVKISRSDFLADKKKERYRVLQAGGPCVFKKTRKGWSNQQQCLIDAEYETTYSPGMVPNYFYYACPPGLIDADEIPVKVGLFYVSDDGRTREIKKAKLLHSEPFKRTLLLDKYYYRMVQLEQLFIQARKEIKEYRKNNQLILIDT